MRPLFTAAGSSPLTRGKRRSTVERERLRGLIPAHAGKTGPATRTRRRSRAHPRSRGENFRRCALTLSPMGSSPLTRGKRRFAPQLLPISRLIPAHAGKTIQRCKTMMVDRAHPRSRGENDLVEQLRSEGLGSSPLTRGKPRPWRRSLRSGRLIPAHAGKTRTVVPSTAARRAHPRSRGENSIVVGMVREGMGSSPLTRGKRRAGIATSFAHGLIPAHAGKTLSGSARANPRRAHPRSRGENHRRSAPNGIKNGSSPLTRGKRQAGRHEAHADRLIPAHAGKTGSRRSRTGQTRAHPRSRGENRVQSPEPDQRRGSSPLTRGKQSREANALELRGLIPAHAGKTPVRRGLGLRHRAHPRSRGENGGNQPHNNLPPGSSPLTRGKHDGQGAVVADGGLIPAHAGKTRSRASWAWRIWAHPRSRGENIASRKFPVYAPGSSPLTRGKRTEPAG